MLSRVVFGVVLPPRVHLGKRSHLGYSGLGAVVHARMCEGAEVRIGQGARIGANAVVTRNVPAGAAAINVLARIAEQGRVAPAAAAHPR